jgi:hypothetical protein
MKRSEMVALIQTAVNNIAYGGEELCLPSEASELLARIEKAGMLPPEFEPWDNFALNEWEPEND